jgi:peptidyl-prolyl cis-trans isomerase C
MRLRGFLLIMAAVLTVLAPGCSKDNDMDESSAGQGSAGGSNGRGSMVVTVNGREVFEDEIAKEMDRIETQLSGRVSSEQMGGMTNIIRQQAINNMVSRVLLEQAADREGITIGEEKVNERSEQIRSGFTSEEMFLEQLNASGLTEAGFKQEIELAIKIETLLESQTGDIAKIPDAEVRDFYEGNIDRFKRAERIKASHILIPIAEMDGEAERVEKRQKIESILDEVRGGADFAEMAAEHSSCPSKTRGGDLGFFGKGQMVEEFENAAFALEVGDVSGIVETKFGYHIIKLTDHEEASTIPFEEARADIESYLTGQKKQQVVTSYIDTLRTAAVIMYPDTSSAE